MPNRGIASGLCHDVSGGGHGRQLQAPQQQQQPCLPLNAQVRTESFRQDARLLPGGDGQKHPARLVGDAICLLGEAQGEIRGKARQRAIKKARGVLIAMLENGGGAAHLALGKGGGGAAGKRRRRRRK